MNTNRILMVDDYKSHRVLFKTFLENAGYEVALASTGEEAYELLHLSSASDKNHGIGIILMDLNLEGESGLNVCKKIKSEKHLRDIPILIITTESAEENIGKAVEYGCLGFIRKPVCQAELVAHVEMVFNWKKQVNKSRQQEIALLNMEKTISEVLRITSHNLNPFLEKIICLGRLLEGSNNILNGEHSRELLDLPREAEEIKRLITWEPL